MEPLEINAGQYYLRALRADRLIDDRPALAEAFTDAAIRHVLAAPGEPDGYIAARAAQWLDDTACSWAVAEPTTGRLLGEVGIVRTPKPAQAYCWTLPAERRRGAAGTALAAVLRFGAGALDLSPIIFRHPERAAAARALAAHCGLVRHSSVTEGAGVEAVAEWRTASD